MVIRQDGSIKSACANTRELLQKRNIYNFLGKNILRIFSQCGPIHPANPTLPETIDLLVEWPDKQPSSFFIRWVPTPLQEDPGDWQLTGITMQPPSAISVPPQTIHGIPDALAEFSSDIVVATGPDGRVIYWNKAAAQFYGFPAAKALGALFDTLVRYEYISGSKDEAARHLVTGGFWEGEVSCMSGEGKKSYLISSVHSLSGSDQEFTGAIAINRDITEQKLAQKDKHRTEMQLREYAEQISDILGSITDGFFVLDKDFRIILWNNEAERITNRPASEVIGQTIREKLPELVDTETYQFFNKAFEKKITVTFEQYNREADRWLEMSVYPSNQGLFVYFKDITLRKKQEALLALEKRVLELNTDKSILLRTILNEFLNGIQQIFPGMLCCVLTLDEDGRSVRLLSAPGLPAVYAGAFDGLQIGPSAGSCGTAMYRKKKVIVADIATDPLWSSHKDMALQFGLRACSSVPVVNEQKEVLAALAVYYKTTRTPSELEWNVIESAAALVTLIIENKRAEERLLQQEVQKQKLIARAMVDAQEKERAEIGKELHDNINQILSTTKLYLELAKNDNKERISLINRSAGNIHEAIHEIRNISRSLVPASIGDLGLLDSITDLVENLRTTRTLHVEFYPAGKFEESISDQKKLMLFRIIQEQVNNVLKHSRAQNLIIELTLEEKANNIELNITDDGIGFNPENIKNKKGQGLSNIMSRADLFGGNVKINSAPGKGCQIKVQVPVL
jgi:PAS domain S-box-containing protein